MKTFAVAVPLFCVLSKEGVYICLFNKDLISIKFWEEFCATKS